MRGAPGRGVADDPGWAKAGTVRSGAFRDDAYRSPSVAAPDRVEALYHMGAGVLMLVFVIGTVGAR